MLLSSILNLKKTSRLDVTSVENALLDLLVRVEDSDLSELGLEKGGMHLVTAEQQVRILGNLGKFTTETELGGSASNALRAMAILGSQVSYSSSIGRDAQGQSFSMRLEQLGILNRLAVDMNSPTGSCVVLVSPDGERTLNTCLGACQTYVKDYLPTEDISDSKLFFTTGYMWDTPNQIEAVESAIHFAKDRGVAVALDLADPFVVNRHGSRFLELLQEDKIDVLFANSQEAQMMANCTGSSAALLLGRWVKAAVVKDGSNGAFLCVQNQIHHAPGKKVNVVDTTGAGDMFAGGFMAGVCKNLEIPECLELAIGMASETISHMGVRVHLPNILPLLKMVGVST
jgi:sugar/nucleoside kinase (ribokinase family)